MYFVTLYVNLKAYESFIKESKELWTVIKFLIAKQINS